MQLQEYITRAEVGRVCKELGIRDWSKLKEPKVTDTEARVILKIVNTEKMPIALKDFQSGLSVELEHGTRFQDANVTNNHPVITGRIVLAHMKESLDYYRLLEVAELEGDLLKAVAAGNAAKIQNYYKKLSLAKIELYQAQLKRLK